MVKDPELLSAAAHGIKALIAYVEDTHAKTATSSSSSSSATSSTDTNHKTNGSSSSSSSSSSKKDGTDKKPLKNSSSSSSSSSSKVAISKPKVLVKGYEDLSDSVADLVGLVTRRNELEDVNDNMELYEPLVEQQYHLSLMKHMSLGHIQVGRDQGELGF